MLGLITSEGTTTISVEKSIIGFVIVSNDLVTDILSMMIDDERKQVLTKLTKTKSGIQKSDHNTIVTNQNMKWKSVVMEIKREVFNMKDKEFQY